VDGMDRFRLIGLQVVLVSATLPATLAAQRPSPAAQDLSRLFADVRDPLFVDWAYLGESGNAMIAKRMSKDILGVTTGGPAAAHRNR
jgi:hypothetical protein